MHWYCKVYIPRDTLHREIHAHISGVPVPKYANIKSVMEQLRMLEYYEAIKDTDNIEKRLNVLIALFECSEGPTADALKKQLEIVHRFYEEPS